MKKYNLSAIMKRAWELVKNAGETLSSGLKKAWKEAKEMTNEIKNAVIEHFGSYNERRYSTPWVCPMTKEGKYNFSEKVGCFTGNKGCEGDLVVYKPVVDTVYGWGQKDYRGNGTIKNFVKWNGTEFVPCDKLGR